MIDDGAMSEPGTSTAVPYVASFAARLLMLEIFSPSDEAVPSRAGPVPYIIEHAAHLIAIADAAKLPRVRRHLERARLAAVRAKR